jgi:hypothetical protein
MEDVRKGMDNFSFIIFFVLYWQESYFFIAIISTVYRIQSGKIYFNQRLVSQDLLIIIEIVDQTDKINAFVEAADKLLEQTTGG